jgi:hypothetical protein
MGCEFGEYEFCGKAPSKHCGDCKLYFCADHKCEHQMCGYPRLIEWVESTPSGERVCVITAEEAVRRQRIAGSLKGYKYLSDLEAYTDFLQIHNAQEILK